jgi:hypothetical protein
MLTQFTDPLTDQLIVNAQIIISCLCCDSRWLTAASGGLAGAAAVWHGQLFEMPLDGSACVFLFYHVSCRGWMQGSAGRCRLRNLDDWLQMVICK